MAGDKLEDALEEDHSDEEYIFTEIEMKLSSIEEACPREGAAATSESAALLAQLEVLADRASDNMIRHLQREETEVRTVG